MNEAESAREALALVENGITNVKVLVGGIGQWRIDNYPLDTPPSAGGTPGSEGANPAAPSGVQIAPAGVTVAPAPVTTQSP